MDGARDRNRTDTFLSELGILSPVRLPVSPPGRAGKQSITNISVRTRRNRKPTREQRAFHWRASFIKSTSSRRHSILVIFYLWVDESTVKLFASTNTPDVFSASCIEPDSADVSFARYRLAASTVPETVTTSRL